MTAAHQSVYSCHRSIYTRLYTAAEYLHYLQYLLILSPVTAGDTAAVPEPGPTLLNR